MSLIKMERYTAKKRFFGYADIQILTFFRNEINNIIHIY